MGAAFLIKGPVALMVSGLAAVMISVWKGRWNWLRPLAFWPGPVIFVLLVVPWFLAIQAATDGQFVQGAIGKDFWDKLSGASEGHGGLPGYHLVFLLIMFIPGLLALLPAMGAAISNVRGKEPVSTETHADALPWIISWIVPTWLVFEFLPTKLPHYVLPAYPALALLIGWASVHALTTRARPVLSIISAVLFAVGMGILLFVTSPYGVDLLRAEAASEFQTLPPEDVLALWYAQTVPLYLLLPAAALAILAFVYAVRQRHMAALFAGIVAVTFLGWHLRVAFMPSQDWLHTTKAAERALIEICAHPNKGPCADDIPAEIQAVGYAEPSFAFELGTDVIISPDSTTDLAPASVRPVSVSVIDQENARFGREALSAIEAQANAQNRCVTKSNDRYTANYADGTPARIVAVKVAPGPCS